MGNKIIVEVDREKLKELCSEIGCCYINSGCVLDCDKTDDKLLVCHIPIATTIYEIKEQNNGNKGTED